MKAIVVDEFVQKLTELRPKDAPFPIPTGPRDLGVEVTHAALTHVDMLYAQGLHQNNRRHVQPPFILGLEFSGVVTSAPPSSMFRPGARVFGSSLGSFAEHICVDERNVRHVPSQWTNAEACAVGASGAISWGALIKVAKVKVGETVLILGASGGLGVMAIQIAKAIGAKVIAVVGDEEKARVVREIGADGVVDYRQPGWEDEVKALTDDSEGVDVVYDAIGKIENGLKCLRYRGRLVIVGFAARAGEMERIPANKILLKSATVHGYRFGEDGRRDPQSTIDAWNGFMKLVEDERIRPVIYPEHYIGLEDIPDALRDLEAHKTWGRAIVRINERAEAEQKARL